MAKKIMIVDDEPDLVDITKARLESAGYLVITVSDGKEAPALVEKEAPDLILLDIMLPGKDGYTVCAELKSNPATRSIPIILFTAKLGDRDSSGTKCGFVEADDFILKPFNSRVLLAKIKRLIK